MRRTTLEHSDLPYDWPALRLKVLRRDGHRCRSCGNKRDRSSLDATPTRLGDYRLHAVVTLCPACRSLIEKLRNDERIAAVFFLRGTTGTRCYVATSYPSMS
jgi:5-methylcytosine-specific restriction endonuclease McrA